MNAIVLDNISFRQGGTAILDDVSWIVGAGEHWAVLGANGSGKTSLLKIVTGYQWPSDGAVTVLGNRFGRCELQKVKQRIGWASSAIGQRLPDSHAARRVVLSGIEATIGLYRQNTDEEMQRAEAALRAVGAHHVADRAYGLLSQGERQRVLIARALVVQPALLVLDEPCVGLDPSARHLLVEDLAGIVHGEHSRPTLVYVTHHIDEIPDWIDRVMLLKEGRVLATGSREGMLTSELLSETFDHACTVEAHEGRYYMRMGEGGI